MSHYKVKEGEIKLLEFLALKIPSSKKEIKRQIEFGACKLNGVVVRIASKKVTAGDLLEWNARASVKSSFDPASILYEDEDLLVYNKPPGVTSDSEGILALLKPYGQFLLVHRLDKDTSGLLILAKKASSEKILTAAFKERAVEKHYVALVFGLPKPKGVIENYLGKIGGYQGQTLYGSVAPHLGKFAKTSWVLQKALKKAAFISCYPETGRTHQIRVHLSEMGHPILGDYQYGKKEAPRLMLHAYKISFLHRGNTLTLHAPIPKDFQEMIKLLT